MNDKNKEAFEKWWEENGVHKGEGHAVFKEYGSCLEAWQTACEYKQKEIFNYRALFEEEHNFRLEEFNRYKKLQAENAKLRLVVDHYAQADDVGAYARIILRELGDK